MPASTVVSPQYRIMQGETVVGFVWSNKAVIVGGSFRVLYDDGTEERGSIDAFTTGSSRAAQVMPSSWVARHDGVLVEGSFQFQGGGAAIRGQTYVQVCIQQDPSDTATCRQTIAQGYLYQGWQVPFGTFVEPGPAGGQGQLTFNTMSQPAANADFATQTCPTGAIWKLRGFYGQLVTGAGVANREFTIQVRSSANRVAGSVASEIQTATLTVDYFGAPPTTSSGVSASLGGGAIGIGMPSAPILAGELVVFVTYNLQALDQWTGTGVLGIEEWVIPN